MTATREGSRTDAAALHLAAAHPAALAPCPRCAVPVRGDRLARHLEQTHGVVETAEAPSRATVTLEGDARLSRGVIIAALAVWGVLFVVVVLVRGPGGDLGVALGFAPGLLLLGALGASFAGRLRATVRIEPDGVHLRALGGLVRKSVRHPSSLTTGRLTELRPEPGFAPDQNGPSREVTTGSYLRLVGTGGSITIGARAPLVSTRWDGCEKGPPVRSWDVTLERVDAMTLEYELAARGQLRPRRT